MLKTALLTVVSLGLAAQTPAPAPAPAAQAAKPARAPKSDAKPAPAPKPAAAPEAKPATSEAKPAAAPAAPKADRVLARINGVEIHESEVDTMYDNLAPQQRAAMQGQGRDKLVANYLEFRVLVAKAGSLGLDKSADYQKKLKLSSYQLLASELLKKESDALQKRTLVTDDEVKAYYDAHKDDFKSPGKFNARHILVKTKGGPNGDQGLSEEDAKKKTDEIKAEFAKGGKWDDLAKKYSEDPGSKDKGGLYEGIAFGQFVPEFETAVKKQEIGKVGDPVKSTFGLHLIQVESRVDAEVQPFEAVKDQAKQKAGQAKQEKVWKEFIEEQKKGLDYQELSGQPAAPAAAAKAPAGKAPAAKAPAAKAPKAPAATPKPEGK